MSTSETSMTDPGAVLSVQRCTDCARYQHPPAPICYHCDSRELEPTPVSGSATLYSWTTVHRPGPSRLGAATPYLVAQVELPEQDELFLHANLPSVRDTGRLRVGMPLRAVLHGDDAEGPIVDFAPIDEEDDR